MSPPTVLMLRTKLLVVILTSVSGAGFVMATVGCPGRVGTSALTFACAGSSEVTAGTSLCAICGNCVCVVGSAPLACSIVCG